MSDNRGGIAGLGFEQDDLIEPALDLHLPLGVDVSLEKVSDVIYDSVSSVTNAGPVEFLIPRDAECSFILDQTRLIGHFIVRQDNGAGDVEEDHKVFLANNFAYNLFSQVEIYLNSVQVCDQSTANAYPFRNFIKTELSYDLESKKCQLKSEGYFVEEPEEIEKYDPTGNTNLTARRDLLTDHKKVYFCSRLGADFMYTDKYLPPNVDIKIKPVRAHPQFGILHNGVGKTYVVLLKDLKLKMRKVLPSPQQRDAFTLKLSRELCYIPYKMTQFKVFVIPANVTTYTVTNVASQILPKQLIMCMIHNQALSQSSWRNPFNFQHFDLYHFNVIKNGQCVFPKAFQPDFANDNYLDLYRHMYDSIGYGISNYTCSISMEACKKGRCFLTVDLTPDRCNSYHIHPDEKGKLDVELGFKTAKTHPIYLLAYSIFNSGLKIDNGGQVIRTDEVADS